MGSRGFLGNSGNKKSPKNSLTTKKSEKNEDGALSAFEGRFKATRMWNGVMKRFRNGMPLKRHRKMMFSYEDSFTGREATDFLMNELPKFYSEDKEITRSNCHMLLKKFMVAGLFLPVRGNVNDEKVLFRENEIYRFSDIPLEKVAATPVLVRRAASFNERCTYGNFSQSREFSRIPRYQKVDDAGRNEEAFFPAVPVISSVPSPNLVKSRRLSSSHGNLPSMFFDSTETAGPKVHEICDLRESDEETLVERRKTAKNQGDLSSLDEVISELQKFGNHTDKTNAMMSIRSFGKVVQSARGEEDSPELPEHRRKLVYTSRSRISPVRLKKSCNNCKDEQSIWEEALENRLRKILRINFLDGIIDYKFTGADVKYNCENVGVKGIVHVRDSKDMLSPHLIVMMRYLARWPFDKKYVEKDNVYPGMEKNVFKTVCEHFEKKRPILPEPVANAILNAVTLIESRHRPRTASSLCESSPVGTEFLENIPSMTHYVELLRKDVDCSCDLANSLQMTPVGPISRDCPSKLPYRDVASIEGSNSTDLENENCSSLLTSTACLSTVNNDLEQDYDALIRRLPGLKSSPELLQRLKELSHSTSNGSMYSAVNYSELPPLKSPSLRLSPLVTNIAKEDEADLIESVALILLTLPPTTRRTLHYLLRFMERICKNHCLQLSPNEENRYVVLECLSEIIIPVNGSISSVQCLHLVTFLVDNQNKVFVVPEALVTETDKMIVDGQSDKKSVDDNIETCENHQQFLEFAENCPEKSQFCEPIRFTEYERQKAVGVESHLLNLLDSIMTNENITPDERRKQLRKFKKVYPAIYSKRFPSAPSRPKKPRTPSFLDRLRNLNFRQ